MKTLTEHLLPQAERMDEHFARGAQRRDHALLLQARYLFRQARIAHGFVDRDAPLLTAPSWNAKLDKGKVPSYGLTLQHMHTRLRPRLIVNACPHAGDCAKVCVLDNGNGSFEAVQEARRAKVRFLVEQPLAFSYLLGYELARARDKHGHILFRPNVNSDVRWDLLIPSCFSSTLWRADVISYGYTKDPFVLDTNGWVSPNYRLAYSWNENSDGMRMADFLDAGGSIAVVTDRRKGAPLPKVIQLGEFWGLGSEIVDADLTDEWMFAEGVIGDLSAKGRARRLIGRSGFVVTTGGA